MGVTTCIWYKNGLFMSMLDDENKWGSPFLLSDNATSDFSAYIDSSDTIHVCFVDYAGRLLHMRACEEKNEPDVLLESRIVGTSPYNVRLVQDHEASYVFYVVSHNRKQLLTCQKLDFSGYSMPEVEGVIIREGKNYAVCNDGSHIHIFFVTQVQSVNLLVHRKITDLKASRPVTTPFSYNPSLRLQAVAGKNGKLYVLASHDEGQDSSILYLFDTIQNKFLKTLEVYNTSSGSGSDSLAFINNNPVVIRSLKAHYILSIVKEDCSGTAEVSRIERTGRDIPLKCRFQSNHKKDRAFKCDLTPMLFGNGLRFPFDIKTIALAKPEKNDEIKDILQKRIRELESRVEFLENTIRELIRP